MILDINKCREI